MTSPVRRAAAAAPSAHRTSQAASTVGALAAAATLLVAVTGCDSSGSPAAQPSAPTVDVAPVMTRPITRWDDFNGRVSAVDAAEVRPRVSGYITQVAYREGGDVRKGDCSS